MKYIITDKNELVLGVNTFHADMAKKATGRVVRAGHVFFNEHTGKAEVHGMSVGFGISAKPEDAAIIDRLKPNAKSVSGTMY